MLRTSVIIATAGRSVLLEQTLKHVVSCYGEIAEIIISVPDESSLPNNLDSGVTVVTGARGLSAQRNAGIRAASSQSEFFVFFDDDTVPAPDYVTQVEKFFDENSSVLGMHGWVLRNGGVNFDEALELVSQNVTNETITASKSLYGCNFAVRSQIARQLGFDERLPLYSWLEDLDFARRVMKLGQLSKVHSAQCVHLAHDSGGRTHHKRLGFSQVMNPIYLLQKRSLNLIDLIELVGRGLAGNLLGSLNPSPKKSWRRERLSGNVVALIDALRGKIEPEKATDF